MRVVVVLVVVVVVVAVAAAAALVCGRCDWSGKLRAGTGTVNDTADPHLSSLFFVLAASVAMNPRPLPASITS